MSFRSVRVVVAPAAVWLALFAFATAARSAPPASQPETWDREFYYAGYLNGKRVGYMCVRDRTLPDGNLENFTGVKLKMAADRNAVSAVITERTVESPDGRPLRFSEFKQLGPTPVRQTGVIEGDTLRLTIEQGNFPIEKSQRWDRRALFGWAEQRLLREKLKADGDQVKIVAYSSDTPGDGFSETTYTRIGYEDIEVSGKTVRALHVRTVNPTAPAPGHDWLDENFDLLVGEMNMGPTMKLRFEACSKAFAHQRFDAPEIFTSNIVRLALPVKQPESVKSLRLTLVYRKPLDRPIELPRTDRQSVVESTRERIVVDLTRPDYPKPPARPMALTDELKAYLQPTATFNVNDPEIVKAAGKAVGDRTDPVEQGRAIRNWVDDHLMFKQFGVAHATASDVLRSRTGDCTEHAALLVALARASGIPARSVTGIVYAAAPGDKRGLMGFHEWAQLYVNGRWVDFDAAIAGDPATAMRLLFNFGSADGKIELNEEAEQPGATPLYQLFGNIKSATASEVTTDAPARKAG